MHEQGRTPPTVSFVMPAYNEAELIDGAVRELVSRARRELGNTGFELLLVENGSTDTTPELVRGLAEALPEVRGRSLPRPSYGEALKAGILDARGPVTVVFNVDFWDLDFAREALDLLGGHHVVVGSKRAPGADDRRGLSRRLVTGGFNLFLRLVFGFEGTDTHGMKALRTAEVRPLARHCVTDREIFDTELILRAQRAGLRITELPVIVREERPTRYSLLSRIPSTAREIRALWKCLGRSGGRTAATSNGRST